MKVNVSNAYDSLSYGAMAYPVNLAISDPSKAHLTKIDKTLACNQYNNLVNHISDSGVKINFLDIANSPSQIYSRDVGFVVKDTLFVSKFTTSERTPETDTILSFAKKRKIKLHKMEQNVEGGDVFDHDGKLFIGVGERTSKEGVEEIRQMIAKNKWNHQIIEVFFDVSKIHLDCVFNILDKDTCLLTSGVFSKDKIVPHFSNVIEVPEEEQTDLGPNIINLGNNNILCSNKKLTTRLKDNGFNAIYIEFSEVAKASGGLGCCLLPLQRGN